MDMQELLDRFTREPDCEVSPAAGQPHIRAPHALPADAQAFYDRCGGLRVGRDTTYEIRIVRPDEMVVAGDIIFSELAAQARLEAPDDASWDWYIIAETGNGEQLAIDLGERHNGRCYDADWQTYAMPGQMPIIATSFTNFLERLLAYPNRGGYFYWLEPDFVALGDAYDM